MAIKTKRAGAHVDTAHREVFIETESDLALLPQTPQDDFSLGSIAYDKKFKIWVLTSSGWEANE